MYGNGEPSSYRKIVRKVNKAATKYTICTSVSCNPSLNESMGSCGSKQKKDEATAGPGSSGRAQSSSSKPNQKGSMPAEGRNDQDDIDAVRYLRKQKESPTKVRRSAD